MFRKRYFWVGLFVRLAATPFLLQWFHPDERQTLEFAHFHAHGRLQPFLESTLHLRNQTLPWLFSWLLRLLDQLGLNTPQAYLIAIHSCIAVCSWLGLCALIEYVREESSDEKRTDFLGWFFALFWGFPFLYSRQLLEAVSLPPTFLMLLAIRRWQPGRAGFCAGLVCVLRYPSCFWAAGGFLLALWTGLKNKTVDQKKLWAHALPLALLGFTAAISLGGLADWATYGKFFESAPAYLAFNRPHGPVEAMFGNDSLSVYWRWFEFLFTPWIAPLFVVLGIFALFRAPGLLLFTLPYLVAHVWTPHREPRFMLPVTPVLMAALVLAWQQGKLNFLTTFWKRIPQVCRYSLVVLAWLHLGLNFVWYPMNAWAQRRSSLGQVVIHYSELASVPTLLLDLADPVIDALIPTTTRWTDRNCHWRSPALPAHALSAKPRIWVLADHAPLPEPHCRPALGSMTSPFSPTLQRILRVRTADFWECSSRVLETVCPQGITEAAPNEPTFGKQLK